MLFRQKLMITLGAIFLSLFFIFGIFTFTTFRDHVSTFVENQNQWLNVYSQSFLSDLQVGKYASVQRKMDYLVKNGSFQYVKLNYGAEEFLVGSEHGLTDTWSFIDYFFNTRQFELNIKLIDRYSTEWGNIVAKISSRSFLQEFKQEFYKYLLYFTSVFFIFSGIMLLIIENLERPIRKLTQDVMKRAKNIEEVRGVGEIQTLSLAFNAYNRMIEETQAKLAKKSREEGVISVANQVVHDIRSPLTALKVVTGSLNEIPENYRLLIREATNRIDGIVSTLTNISEDEYTDQNLKPVLLVVLIEHVLAEKRIQHQEIDKVTIDFIVSDHSFDTFVKFSSVELKRVFSNILSNAIESIPSKGRVEISLTKKDHHASVKITDNGVGIPSDVLEKLGRDRISYRKISGKGLGLYHAFKNLHKASASIEITSTPGRGTEVEMIFPLTRTPAWFPSSIALNQITNVIILDDDSSIHQVWKNRLQNFKISHHIKLHHFYDSTSFENWISVLPSLTGYLFLVDYELLGSPVNGQEIIHRNVLENHSILVSSHYADESLLDLAMKTELKILPKSLAQQIPIV